VSEELRMSVEHPPKIDSPVDSGGKLFDLEVIIEILTNGQDAGQQ
jgi:hypothetical protein